MNYINIVCVYTYTHACFGSAGGSGEKNLTASQEKGFTVRQQKSILFCSVYFGKIWKSISAVLAKDS